MGVKIGDYIKVKTTTLEDVFGNCVYKITGPDIETKEGTKTKCILLHGTGKAAKPGLVIFDSLEVIDENIKNGVTTVITQEEGKEYEEKVEL